MGWDKEWLLPFTAPHWGKVIRVMTDNVSCKLYINKQRRARSPSLCTKAIKFWNWCIIHHIQISAVYHPGIQNTTTNALSRHFSYYCKWELDTQVLHRIFQRWGLPERDLFATFENGKCPLFCSRGCLVIILWGRPSFYHGRKVCFMPFPPTVLFLGVLNMIRQDKARVILIVPTWPRQVWYSYLLQLCVQLLSKLPTISHLLSQDVGRVLHPNLVVLCLRLYQ